MDMNDNLKPTEIGNYFESNFKDHEGLVSAEGVLRPVRRVCGKQSPQMLLQRPVTTSFANEHAKIDFCISEYGVTDPSSVANGHGYASDLDSPEGKGKESWDEPLLLPNFPTLLKDRYQLLSSESPTLSADSEIRSRHDENYLTSEQSPLHKTRNKLASVSLPINDASSLEESGTSPSNFDKQSFSSRKSFPTLKLDAGLLTANLKKVMGTDDLTSPMPAADLTQLALDLEQIKRRLLLYEQDYEKVIGSGELQKENIPRCKSDRIAINVGGIRHEIYRSTLKNIPDTRLSWIAEESAIHAPEYDPERGEFFFDRHPQVFSHILNYYRTGNLHVPYDVCGPLFEEELNYWGIDDTQVESCCWLTYRQHRDAQETLKEFEGIEFEREYDDESEPDLSRYGFNIQAEMTAVDEDLSWYQKYQPKIWKLMEDPYSSMAAKVIAYSSMCLIVLSVLLFCLETMEYFQDDQWRERSLSILDGICVFFFTLELGVRLLFCPNKLDFLKGVMNWIDFISILPFFITLAMQSSVGHKDMFFKILQSIRVVRVFRIIKLSRHSIGLQILGHTLKASFRELLLLIFFLAIGIVIFSSLVFYCEKDSANTKFTSIPNTFWWAVITMTTVGYGDMTPRTAFGKVFGSLCAISGVLMIALPVPVIVNNFNLYYSHAQARLKLPKKKRRVLVGAANALKGPAMESYVRDHDKRVSLRDTVGRRTSLAAENQAADDNEEDEQDDVVSLRIKRFARRDSNMFASGTGRERQNNGHLSPNLRRNSSLAYATYKRKSLLPSISSLPEIEQ